MTTLILTIETLTSTPAQTCQSTAVRLRRLARTTLARLVRLFRAPAVVRVPDYLRSDVGLREDPAPQRRS